MAIDDPWLVEPQVASHRVVVCYQDDTAQWFGIDGIQPLQEYHLASQSWQLRIIEPLPTRTDGHPQTLCLVSQIVADCRFNSWYESVPYFSDLLEVA
jgi:hypothetical protein